MVVLRPQNSRLFVGMLPRFEGAVGIRPRATIIVPLTLCTYGGIEALKHGSEVGIFPAFGIAPVNSTHKRNRSGFCPAHGDPPNVPDLIILQNI